MLLNLSTKTQDINMPGLAKKHTSVVPRKTLTCKRAYSADVLNEKTSKAIYDKLAVLLPNLKPPNRVTLLRRRAMMS